MINILVADDKKVVCDLLEEILKNLGHNVILASDGKEALEKFTSLLPEILITDMKMPGMSGLDLLKEVKRINPETVVIVMTAFGTIENAVEAMKSGAYDYITKPLGVDQIVTIIGKAVEHISLRRENKQLKEQLQNRYKFDSIIGHGGKMNEVFEIMAKVLDNRATVVIEGETGTGKELIAKAIHYNGPRRDAPFVKVNCSAIPESLLESELFGHEKGAFTGAIKDREGRFEIADKGTLFLDEIGEISPAVQVKLLRVLQFKEFERVGSSKTIKVDVRIIAATNKKLSELVAQDKFRKDLYYRLNVVPIRVPPLRERTSDIPALAEHFIKKFAAEVGKNVTGITPAALKILLRYHWPGNVREFENVIERAIIMTNSEKIEPADLPEYLQEPPAEIDFPVPPAGSVRMTDFIDRIEKTMLLDALKKCNGSQTQAAELLGINRGTLIYKMKKFGISS